MDPTARADAIASDMRAYYETHRDSIWDRITKPWRWRPDNLMLGLLAVAREGLAEPRPRGPAMSPDEFRALVRENEARSLDATGEPLGKDRTCG